MLFLQKERGNVVPDHILLLHETMNASLLVDHVQQGIHAAGWDMFEDDNKSAGGRPARIADPRHRM
jgi:hypothetical protein